MATALEQFMTLFRGFENGHGQHELSGQPDASGKIKGKAYTKSFGASEKEYMAHLEGKGVSLGLIPLMADNRCWFGAIDIDVKGDTSPLKEPIEQLEARVRKLEFPLVVCRSKSGGAHLYLFCNEPILAKDMHSRLAHFSQKLGYGGCELFPKQFTRVNENDRGNWINIAMYGCLSKEGTTRYCIRNGKHITKLEDFVKYASLMRYSLEKIQKVDVQLSELFSDGPPCLQTMVSNGGFGEGGRNNALTNVGIYFKMCDNDNWDARVKEFNDQHVSPPLGEDEVRQVTRNLSRKDYFYTCKIPPISNYCDKKLCCKRQFGITFQVGQDVPRIENITKCIAQDSVRWYGEYQGNRFEFTSEFFSSGGFRKTMLEKFSVLIMIKQQTLDEMMNEALKSAETVIDPDDASRQGQFQNMLDNYFGQSRPARNKDELIKGNAFLEDGRVMFRSEELFKHLKINRFEHTPHEVWMWLKKLGAEEKQIRVKGRKLRVWTLPEPEKFDTTTGIELPQQVEEEL
jgi:hypothetical protein